MREAPVELLIMETEWGFDFDPTTAGLGTTTLTYTFTDGTEAAAQQQT
jgi:hypothetical protein